MNCISDAVITGKTTLSANKYLLYCEENTAELGLAYTLSAHGAATLLVSVPGSPAPGSTPRNPPLPFVVSCEAASMCFNLGSLFAAVAEEAGTPVIMLPSSSFTI